MAGVIHSEELFGGVAFSFADLEVRARAIVQRAELQAAQIVKEAERRARELIEQRARDGYQRGAEQGRAAGLEQVHKEARAAAREEARQRVAALIDALSGGVAELESNKRRLLALAESGLIELAVAIARRVCKTAVGRDSEAARVNAQHLLELVGHEHDARLHVSAADHAALRELAPALLAQAGRAAHVEIVADENLKPGDCLLRTRAGTFDASIDVQLDRIAEQIGAG